MLQLIVLLIAAIAAWLLPIAVCWTKATKYPLTLRARLLSSALSFLLTVTTALTSWRLPHLFVVSNSTVASANWEPAQVPLWFVVSAVCLLAAFYATSAWALMTDYGYQKLPNSLNLSIWIIALVLLLLLRWHMPASLFGILAVAAIVTVVLLLGNIAFHAIGLGDVKLVGALVVILAALNTRTFLLAGIGFCVVALISAVVAAAHNKWDWQTRFAFGPTLIFATYAGLSPYLLGVLAH